MDKMLLRNAFIRIMRYINSLDEILKIKIENGCIMVFGPNITVTKFNWFQWTSIISDLDKQIESFLFGHRYDASVIFLSFAGCILDQHNADISWLGKSRTIIDAMHNVESLEELTVKLDLIGI